MVQKKVARTRGRPRAYDPDAALKGALDAFWRQGYSGTSLEVLSDATDTETLLQTLGEELARLRDAAPDTIDTTLIVHPHVLQDFLDYNDFLDQADGLVEVMELEGVLQVASFHPHYQFADSGPEDVENFTNRSPWPTLHLLREESVSRAVAAFPNPDVIVERNVETLRKLGVDGWRKLFL